MIADDRESQIVDRRKFCDRLRSYGNPLLRSFAIVCDPAIVIAEDRTMFYLLRSSAIVCDRLRSCDHMETKVLRSAIETYPIIILILTQMIQRFLSTKPECSFMFVTMYCSVRNTKFSQQCVESPKFLSLHEYFSNSKPMFPPLLKLTMQSLQDEKKK